MTSGDMSILLISPNKLYCLQIDVLTGYFVMQFFLDLFQQHFWIFQLCMAVFFTVTGYAVTSRILHKLMSRSEHTHFIYDKALLKAGRAPLLLSIWIIGLCISAQIILSLNANPSALRYLSLGKSLSIALIMAWTAMRFIRNLETQYIHSCVKNSKEVDKTLVHAVSKLLTISVAIVALLAMMQIFGFPISGLLAFGGIGGAAIAFASKDLLANFFGGFIIYMDRPFKVGDWIRSPDKQIEGTVEFIGWRVTRIRTFDKRPLYVPNGIFLTISVENPSRMLNRRIKANIGIRYKDGDKMDVITNQVRQMLIDHPEIDSKQTLIVNLVEFGPSSLNFMVYTFTKTTNWVRFQEIQHDVFMKILHIIKANQAECAFPSQTLYIDREHEEQMSLA